MKHLKDSIPNNHSWPWILYFWKKQIGYDLISRPSYVICYMTIYRTFYAFSIPHNPKFFLIYAEDTAFGNWNLNFLTLYIFIPKGFHLMWQKIVSKGISIIDVKVHLHRKDGLCLYFYLCLNDFHYREKVNWFGSWSCLVSFNGKSG